MGVKVKLRARAIIEWTYEVDPEEMYGPNQPPPLEVIIQEDTEAIMGEWWAYVPGYEGEDNPEGLIIDSFVIEDASVDRPPLLIMPNGMIHEVERASDEIEAGTPSVRWRIVERA